MSASVDVLAWRVIGPIVGSVPGWIGVEDRQPPPMGEVHENGCRLELLTGSGAAVAELVEVAKEVLSADDEALLALRNLGVKTPPESHGLTEKLRAALEKFGGAA